MELELGYLLNLGHLVVPEGPKLLLPPLLLELLEANPLPFHGNVTVNSAMTLFCSRRIGKRQPRRVWYCSKSCSKYCARGTVHERCSDTVPIDLSRCFRSDGLDPENVVVLFTYNIPSGMSEDANPNLVLI